MIEVLDNLWLPIDSKSGYGFDFFRFLLLLMKYKIRSVREFLICSWAPFEEQIYSYDPKTKLFNLSKLSARCLSLLIERVHAFLLVGCTPVISLVEGCGYRSKWATHPHNPARNLQSWGAKDWVSATSETCWIDKFYKPIVKQLLKSLLPEDRNRVVWELGNEPPKHAIGAQGYLAEWLLSMGIPKSRIQAVAVDQAAEEFIHNKTLKKAVGTVTIHGIDTLAAAQRALEDPESPFWQWDKTFNILFSTDGHVLSHVKQTEIEKLLRQYGSLSVLCDAWASEQDWQRVEQVMGAMQRLGAA